MEGNNLIMVTGFGALVENVLVITEKFTDTGIKDLLKEQKINFDDVFHVKQDELQFYSYEPLWLDD